MNVQDTVEMQHRCKNESLKGRMTEQSFKEQGTETDWLVEGIKKISLMSVSLTAWKCRGNKENRTY